MSDVCEGLTIQGKWKKEILADIRNVMDGWELSIPPGDPDLWHFGMDDWDNIGITVFEINNNEAEGYCGLFMFLFKGQVCPMHHHKVKHETFFIVKGRVEMTYGDKTWIMERGHRLVVDQNYKHLFKAVEDCLILEVSKPDIVNDSIFDDQRINEIISAG